MDGGNTGKECPKISKILLVLNGEWNSGYGLDLQDHFPIP